MLFDAKLLTRVQAGDDASFEALFLRHYDRVYPEVNEIANQPFQCVAANLTFSAQFHMWHHAKMKGIGVEFSVNIHDAVSVVLTDHERRRCDIRA